MGIFDIFRISKIKMENEQLRRAISQTEEQKKFLQQQVNSLNSQLIELGVTEYNQTKAKIEQLSQNISAKNDTLKSLQDKINSAQAKIDSSQDKLTHIDKSIDSQSRKLARCKELYKSMEHAIHNFFNADPSFNNCRIPETDLNEADLLAPSVILKLHCLDVKSLKKAYKDNEKLIDSKLKQYSARYTTKANQSIYQLMVIALRAELQNVLYNLKYDKLDKAIDDIKKISAKYLKIAADGNQSIAGTVTKFVGEMEYLFINAVKIEYNYYVKKEQARQEQLAIREQMRQEAEERKALEAAKKKIEKEEEKFRLQLDSLSSQAANAEGDELAALQKRILELQAQLSDVIVKKDEIINLQNGKAGNVYIISNLGSFGDEVFKIGMTRRLDPQDRVNELGNASVPFRFDVHSFIFSDDAPALESELHKRLNNNRINKVNLRKEFFRVSIDELENLVYEICPTAEFNKTMLAEEFHQSESSDEIYTSDFIYDEPDDDDDSDSFL